MTHKTPFQPLILLLAALALAWPTPAPAQEQVRSLKAPTRPESRKREKVQYPFDATDMVNGYIGPMKKDLPTTQSHYFVGEPIVIPLTLANHTRFPITLLTNFNPRSQLKIMIRPEGQPQFRYNGPYVLEGFYPPQPIFLFPLEEYYSNLILWADYEAPGHLALPKPGTYTIDISLNIAIDEGTGGGELKPFGGTFTVTVDPTPKDLEPVVDLLQQHWNILYLQLHKYPPEWGDKGEQYAQMYHNTIFGPYIFYSLASNYVVQYESKPTDENRNKAMQFYQLAVLRDSPFWEEAYVDMLTFFDKQEQVRAVVDLSRRMLERAPEWRRGRIGNLEIMQRYLGNTKELDPEKYWAFLP